MNWHQLLEAADALGPVALDDVRRCRSERVAERVLAIHTAKAERLRQESIHARNGLRYA